MPQIASVGLVGGFRDAGRIGTQEDPAVFRRNTNALRVLRDSGLVKTEGPEFAAPLAPSRDAARTDVMEHRSKGSALSAKGAYLRVGVGSELGRAHV